MVRPPIALERMLRIHFVRHWFNLADLACEEALYDSLSLRRFVGIDLGSETVPDATTLLKFRHLLDEHKLGEGIFAEVGQVLQARGAKLKSGTIVDATLIGAPSSTKNKDDAVTIDIIDTALAYGLLTLTARFGLVAKPGCHPIQTHLTSAPTSEADRRRPLGQILVKTTWLVSIELNTTAATAATCEMPLPIVLAPAPPEVPIAIGDFLRRGKPDVTRLK
jgi:IS5 family transposase